MPKKKAQPKKPAHLTTKKREGFIRFDKGKLMFYTNVNGERDYSCNASHVKSLHTEAKKRRPLSVRVLNDWWASKGSQTTTRYVSFTEGAFRGLPAGNHEITEPKWKVQDFNSLFRLNGDLIVLKKDGETNIEASTALLLEVIKTVNENLTDNPKTKKLTIPTDNWLCWKTGRTWVSPKVKSQGQSEEQKIDNAADALLKDFPLSDFFKD